jgi:hypothetical protein
MAPEARPKMQPNRTHSVHRRENEAPSMVAPMPRFHSGRGGIRTHGTLSRTHTFQTSVRLAHRVRLRAQKRRIARILRAHDTHSNECLRAGTYTQRTQRAAVSRETGALTGAFDNLCERCPTGWRVVGDTLCAACRREVDALYHDLPGARV